MTNYQMPVLTDSERKELAEYLTACVENRCVVMPISDTLRLDRLRNHIALASLMAPPFMYAIADCDGQAHFDEYCVSANPGELADEIDGLNDFREEADFVDSLLYHEVPVYKAPPVPALKLPGISSLIDNSEGLPSVRDVAIWDAAIAEVKRLNGVTTGGEAEG